MAPNFFGVLKFRQNLLFHHLIVVQGCTVSELHLGQKTKFAPPPFPSMLYISTSQLVLCTLFSGWNHLFCVLKPVSITNEKTRKSPKNKKIHIKRRMPALRCYSKMLVDTQTLIFFSQVQTLGLVVVNFFGHILTNFWSYWFGQVN